jgi:pimeloyl-ACP methyl ester carboxylesterase
LYYEIYGLDEHPTLILLHGNGESLCNFVGQIDYFASYYQVLAIDSRGHGCSNGTPIGYAQMADDVLAIMNALNINKAHLLGFSDGGIQALYLGIKEPQRFHSLILAGVNYDTNGFRFNTVLANWLTYSWLCIKALFSGKAQHKKRIWSLMLFQPHFSEAELQNIAIPTLVIAGEYDMIREKHTRKLASLLSNAELQIVPDADHFLPYKNPEVFNKIVMNFLNKQKEN